AKPMRIGIAWAGSAGYRDDRRRSVSLGCLTPLLSDRAVETIGLQREIRVQDEAIVAESPNLRVGTTFEDFADTAAVVSMMDVVVSVDTAVAHVAGALGVPVLIMLPESPDFRWMLDRSDSPWYPTAKLFRQERRGDWDGVTAEVAKELAGIAAPPS